MLEPRGTDLPVLFLVLVVVPLVAYVLLGRWSESSKKNERISLLAEFAAEETLRAETMVAASVIPVIPLSKSGIHVCARCSVPATTRCSRCKSVRYCSGKCQILHWRQVHKHECLILDTNSCSSSPMASVNGEYIYERLGVHDEMDLQYSGNNINQAEQETISGDDWLHRSNDELMSASNGCTRIEDPGTTMMERRSSSERRVSRKSKSRRDDEDANTRNKLKNIVSEPSPSEEDMSRKHNDRFSRCSDDHSTRGTKPENCSFQGQHKKINNLGIEEFLGEGNTYDDMVDLACTSEMALRKTSIKGKTPINSTGSKIQKSQKSVTKASQEQTCSNLESNEQYPEEPIHVQIKNTIPTQGRNGVSSTGFMKMIGLKKPRELDKVVGERQKKLKMLFPYEEFAKFFQYEVFNLSPRGLVNCGNSCYANAVMQCLILTKPLTIYLLGRLHSKACCTKNWCLMCELEKHVIMLKQRGGPLSPGRLLTHMRRINRQIGDGSQEDAHEFLRLLLTSMQSICLEGWGGENVVDPRLQETTFVQHTFGGRLKSKVKCLSCHHESERFENMMDLTLEIFGWVESLEDALTQFTTPEDLDGENMYRCGRCSAYVRAQKQLNIHEAPNILTIVLKRFQEGSYGKLNKCITFPEMLDMVPFMTGLDDIPPLYMLYGVVVHVDTQNASFSGHYISYVKDLQGNWLRIDDTEVQPVSVSQVMSEGAYILFYMRSCPRPARAYFGKPTWHHHTSGLVKQFTSKNQKSSRPVQSKTSCRFVGPDSSSELRSTNYSKPPRMERYAESFSDATTSSDWSIFTSSDDASFTTESRDSFSTVDYADGSNLEPFLSIFDTIYGTGTDYLRNSTISCRMFSSTKPMTRFFSEEQGVVLDSYPSCQRYGRIKREMNPREVAGSTHGLKVTNSSRTYNCCTL